jgi:dihydrofolate synthase/folylpolyglutamate synthase
MDPPLVRLAERARFSVRLGLDRMRSAVERLGHPERSFAAVHLAGTNGKGSTAAMLASCLSAADHVTGLFTSPHLNRFSERIVVAGREISQADLDRTLDDVLSLDESLTFFEVATLAAFCHFARCGVDIAVVETGLGGRLDATNVLEPLVSVITPIGLDHMHVLGDDLATIAREKAGIIKRQTPVVSAAQAPQALAPLQQRCVALDARLYLAGRDFGWEEETEDRLAFRGWRSEAEGLRVALRGEHQRDNAALAWATLELLGEHGISTALPARRRGLRRVRWPGRMEWIGRFLLDSAHNPAAARVLVAALADRDDWTLVFGAARDKQAAGMLACLRPRVARVVLTPRPQRPGSTPRRAARSMSRCGGGG